jgi:hypothetical protein
MADEVSTLWQAAYQQWSCVDRVDENWPADLETDALPELR